MAGTLKDSNLIAGRLLTINGEPPAVLFERDADQILTAQVSYEVDYGYAGGDFLFARVEPFGASPARLSHVSPRCAIHSTLGTDPDATVDVLLQNDGWVGAGARVGYTAGSFELDPPPDALPPPQRRSFQFAFGVLCQDSEVERTEQFRVTVWFQRLGGRVKSGH